MRIIMIVGDGVADHVTSLRLRKHTGDPVPISAASEDAIRDGVRHYSERAACRGGLCRIRGKHVMPLVLNLIGKPERIGG